MLPNSLDLHSPTTQPMWCLVGNLGGVRHVDAPGPGTRHFAHGTKLYCLPPYCGDGYDTVQVYGRSRGGRVIAIILATKKIVNWRAELVYSPAVLKRLRDNNLWTEERAREAAAFLTKRMAVAT
jgi:hypothetical protein